ncbi:glutathionylspermidine synthase family protein [Ferrimonas lipolytica]|uniref:Glutathionylspermidine synthase family protein n=1 Tax=Ferrimonas lipolytica TaxID=2724191 RepID=A0A6H1UCW2_9GAMM|nr:glutathionylspermidine synthase family protein [Ferrimonas lipolytica]QIZ76193.1 glutathionylspermidine synthase family protein [Ferrimonas lipolytica]
MKRHLVTPRAHWQAQAEEFGFDFHTMYDEVYWDESRYYQFSLEQIENDIEDPTEEIGQMCLEAVDKVVNSEQLLEKFAIPQAHWDTVARAWRLKEPSLYARIDLAYDGTGPAKLLENNADTPTSLYESGFFQWLWLEDRIKDGTLASGADQFNSIQESLIDRFSQFKQEWPPVPLHFASCLDSIEDRGTVQYLQDCAEEAGFKTVFSAIEHIGLSDKNEFLDANGDLIRACFKLYPWEFMLREEFGDHIAKANVRWLEPEWKSVLSNKALLPLLWQMFPNHPNLLPAYFADEADRSGTGQWVKKPIYSREGANIEILDGGKVVESSGGEYGEEGFIIQAYQQLPKFGDDNALIGSWLIGDKAAGISVREDHSRITQDLSRFIPHCIVD